MFFKKPPKDAPHSADQSDLPKTSQLMPLGDEPPAPRPKPLAHWEREGVYVSPQQIAELRILINRRDRAQADLTSWYEQFIERRRARG
jgi:hypothetical protein